jgi:hypothetical protein
MCLELTNILTRISKRAPSLHPSHKSQTVIWLIWGTGSWRTVAQSWCHSQIYSQAVFLFAYSGCPTNSTQTVPRLGDRPSTLFGQFNEPSLAVNVGILRQNALWTSGGLTKEKAKTNSGARNSRRHSRSHWQFCLCLLAYIMVRPRKCAYGHQSWSQPKISTRRVDRCQFNSWRSRLNRLADISWYAILWL